MAHMADHVWSPSEPGKNRRRMVSAATPAVFALVYPAFVDLFHLAVGNAGTTVTPGGAMAAGLMLALMLAVPAYAFLKALHCPALEDHPSSFEIRARRLAYASVVAPTLYCMVGVMQILLHSPLPDEVSWALIWAVGTVWFVCAPLHANEALPVRPSPKLRVAHGISALIVLLYVAFHLFNHLFGWEGEQAHAAVMAAGRKVYRSAIGEPILVVAMLFQTISGLGLAWRWSAHRGDFHRTFQVASGLYLAVYILGHMNSVFVLARAYFGIQTGWGFATGAPNGLIHDAWSVRLIPHYFLAVFFVIGHLFSGLRVVMLTHGTNRVSADRIWLAGVIGGATLALVIMLAMCGMRFH